MVGLKLNDGTGLHVWVDGKPVDTATELTLPLDVGQHKVTFGVNLLTREQPLRVELIDISGSKAQAQFVGK